MFSMRLSQLREELGLTRKEVAEKLNIDQTTYGKYELSKRQPDYDTLQKLASFFNVSVDYLLGRTEIRNSKHNAHITKAYHSLSVDGLPDDAIKQVEDYIEYIKSKYNPDGTKK